MRSHQFSAIMLTAWLAGAAGPAPARTWHVPAEAPTVAAGIDSALAGDVVAIRGGTYHESGLILKSGLTIRSEDPLGGVTIDAGGAGRIFYGISLDSVILTGLTLTGGYAASGAALNLQACRKVEIRNCTILANTTFVAIGGAMQIGPGTSIVIEDCLFQDNDCVLDDGGAIWLSTGEADIIRCTFVANHAVNGGAISCSGPGARITQCVFAANNAYNGGALDFRANTAIVTDCLFVGNTATRGGAVGCWYESTPQFTGCTLVGNEASDQGGGIFCTSSAVATVERSIIAFNTGGGAVACQFDGRATLSCSDVHGNTGGDWTGCLAGQEAIDGNFNLDPAFCPGPDGPNWQLGADSPCLPANSPCNVLVGAFAQGCGMSAVPVAELAGPLRLLGNRPNPFNPATLIAFALDRPATIDLLVYDLAGRLVKTLATREHLEAGRHELRWDGRDGRGRPLAAGTFVYRLVSGPHEATGAAVLLK